MRRIVTSAFRVRIHYVNRAHMPPRSMAERHRAWNARATRREETRRNRDEIRGVAELDAALAFSRSSRVSALETCGCENAVVGMLRKSKKAERRERDADVTHALETCTRSP